MTIRATFSLDNETNFFLQQVAGANKSAYINNLIRREKQRVLKESVALSNKEEAENKEYQSLISEWEVTLSDGLTK
jgi:antitoxin CcdA